MADSSSDDASARVRAIFGDVVTAKSLHEPVEEDSDAEIVDLLTRVCYFYPQYTLEAANELTNSEVMALLLQAEKQRAIELYNYTLIAAAPHTKKAKLVDKLTKQYRKIADL